MEVTSRGRDALKLVNEMRGIKTAKEIFRKERESKWKRCPARFAAEDDRHAN
jgi:hypothetical protein